MSSVYAVKMEVKTVLNNYPDCYDYTSGITGDDTSDHITYEPTAEALAEMKLTPYTGLDSEPLIRYLYTGREYNIETGDYYYRYRMMEAGIGRFTSKDPKFYLNLYRYVKNNPMAYKDKFGTSEGGSTNNEEYCEGLLTRIECLNKQIDVLIKNKPAGYQQDISKIHEDQAKLKSEYENNCDIEAVEIWTPEEQAIWTENTVNNFLWALEGELTIFAIFIPELALISIDAWISGGFLKHGFHPKAWQYGYKIKRRRR